MDESTVVLRVLRAYARRVGSPNIGFAQLAAFCGKYVERFIGEQPDLSVLQSDREAAIRAGLTELAGQGVVRLTTTDSAVESVFFVGFFLDVVLRGYQELLKNPDLPFPSPESFSIDIPQDEVTVVDIKEGFVHWATEYAGPTRILLLRFPDDLPSVVVGTDTLSKHMPSLSVFKMRQYLRTSKNAAYIYQKITPGFKGRELALRELLSQVVAGNDAALALIQDPTDLSFQFWTQLASTVIKEFQTKPDKLVAEFGYCQAAYMIGYYVVVKKGSVQREKDQEFAIQQLERKLQTPPYTFTIQEILAMTDDKGVPLSKRCAPNAIESYVSAQLAPPPNKNLPPMVRLKTADLKEYFVFREFVGRLVIDGLDRHKKAYRDVYVNQFSRLLRADKRVEAMDNDELFADVVDKRLRADDPLLASMLNFSMLYLICQEQATSPAVKQDLTRLFDAKAAGLLPTCELLGLDRKQVLSDAKMLLPVWMVVPVLNGVVRFFGRLFSGSHNSRTAVDSAEQIDAAGGVHSVPESRQAAGKGKKRPGATDRSPADDPAHSAGATKTNKEQLAAFRERVAKIAEEVIGGGTSVDGVLSDSESRWNPLVEPTAKKNLVEDVNSLCRDAVRKLKLSYRKSPPDAKRIHEMAERLAAADSFDRIKRKDHLTRYMEAYILKIISKI